MRSRRVLLLWLDGYDPAAGDALMAEGRLPALQRLRAESARFALDHGAARWTGLAGEHLSTGRSADATGLRSPLHFDPARYTIWQEGTSRVPFPAALRARTVVFDPTYFDLERAPSVRGIVHWGAHDPGAAASSRPAELRAEIASRFGPYPIEWIYGYVWPSPARAKAMGEALVAGAEKRADAARWLLTERCPDWDLAIVVGGELHSAAESLWHGYDRRHPLHAMPSAAPARAAFIAAYEAADRMVGRLRDAFPDAAFVVCAMHGMGPNASDVPSMVLLPELLFRHHFGAALLKGRPDWVAGRDTVPPVAETHTWWPGVVKLGFTAPEDWSAALKKRAEPEEMPPKPAWPEDGSTAARMSVEAIAATWYRRFWPAMRAFALPSYYDGRIRINLAGREAKGRVPRWAYGFALNAMERLVRGCRDIRTGEPVVASVVRTARDNPHALDATDADLHVIWRGSPLGFVHERLGRIGPVPYQRPGGHTGGYGTAFVTGSGLAPGDYGLRSSFDVVPTVVDLLGEAKPAWMSGKSLFAGATVSPLRLVAE
ncbi:MAG TPA: alkaline phosphatase family protein [Alphaproteobacteria bacterium]|jgi:predicted AlkP superfamily phosphohydrolase/phosphomutase